MNGEKHDPKGLFGTIRELPPAEFPPLPDKFTWEELEEYMLKHWNKPRPEPIIFLPSNVFKPLDPKISPPHPDTL